MGERALLLDALGRLDTESATLALVAALEDEVLGAVAEDALSVRGPAIAGAVRVVASLESTNPRLRGRAGRVLHAWGPDALPLALGHAARRYDQERTRRLLGDALRAIGPERCAPFVSGLWNNEDADPVARKEVAEALRILDATTAASLVEAVVAVVQSTTRAARPLDYSTLMLVTERGPRRQDPCSRGRSATRRSAITPVPVSRRSGRTPSRGPFPSCASPCAGPSLVLAGLR